MTTFIATFILTILILGVVVMGFSIKFFFDKNAEFKGGCASNNPMLRNAIGECVVCGQKPGNNCDESSSTLPKIN